MNTIVPPDVIEWLTRYGMAVAFLILALLVVAFLFRPIVLWWSGKTELLDRLRRLEETERKVLLELEILNKTLSIPLKRKAPSEPEPEEPLVVTQETKDQFLKALKRPRP